MMVPEERTSVARLLLGVNDHQKTEMTASVSNPAAANPLSDASEPTIRTYVSATDRLKRYKELLRLFIFFF